MSDYNTSSQSPQGSDDDRSVFHNDSSIGIEKCTSIKISNPNPSSTTDAQQAFSHHGSVAPSEVSGQLDQYSSTNYTIFQPQREPLFHGNNSDIHQGQFMDESRYLAYDESQNPSIQQQTMNTTSYEIPRRNISQNTPLSTEFDAMDASNSQINPDTESAISPSQFISFQSSGTITRYEAFDELLMWE